MDWQQERVGLARRLKPGRAAGFGERSEYSIGINSAWHARGYWKKSTIVSWRTDRAYQGR